MNEHTLTMLCSSCTRPRFWRGRCIEARQDGQGEPGLSDDGHARDPGATANEASQHRQSPGGHRRQDHGLVREVDARAPNVLRSRVCVGARSIYLVMEFLEHEVKDLMEAMRAPFSPSEVKCLMVQLLSGVRHLHDNWILHRDLKTSNLLLNNKGILKICDFGLAREYGDPLKPYTQPVVTLWYRYENEHEVSAEWCDSRSDDAAERPSCYSVFRSTRRRSICGRWAVSLASSSTASHCSVARPRWLKSIRYHCVFEREREREIISERERTPNRMHHAMADVPIAGHRDREAVARHESGTWTSRRQVPSSAVQSIGAALPYPDAQWLGFTEQVRAASTRIDRFVLVPLRCAHCASTRTRTNYVHPGCCATIPIDESLRTTP